jgi:hypothetical protein
MPYVSYIKSYTTTDEQTLAYHAAILNKLTMCQMINEKIEGRPKYRRYKVDKGFMVPLS